MKQPDGGSAAGAVIFHNYLCRYGGLILNKVNIVNGTPVVVGQIALRFVMVGLTYHLKDRELPAPTGGARDLNFSLRFDQITTSKDLAGPNVILTGAVQCLPYQGSNCAAVPGYTPSAGRLVSDWQAGNNVVVGWLSSGPGTGPDLTSIGTFQPYAGASDGQGAPTAYAPSNTMRCDSAAYLSPTRGCIYNETVQVLVFETADPNVNESAQHIFDAFFDTGKTVPINSAKVVPGSWSRRSVVHRLYANTTKRNANRTAAVNMCKFFYGADYATSAGYARDCDEFPFSATAEGASTPGNNWSARVLEAGDNRRAGARYGTFLSYNRILDGEEFSVAVGSSCSGIPVGSCDGMHNGVRW